ncbi:TPA: hypothetical protein ACS8CD_003663 [Providencia alcalifaciens]
MNNSQITHCQGVPIQQIKLVSIILLEISNQHPGIEIGDTEFAVIVNAANSICSAFLAKEGNNND